jgi:hypothetical protein
MKESKITAEEILNKLPEEEGEKKSALSSPQTNECIYLKSCSLDNISSNTLLLRGDKGL